MPERTVRHGLVAYETKGEDGMLRTHRVFRGETHDFPEDVVERFEPHGAFMDEVGAEPPVFGTLSPLPVNPSDEEIYSFVRSATGAELITYVRDHPDHASAISEALQRYATDLPPAVAAGSTTIDGLQAHPPIEPAEGEGTGDDEDGAEVDTHLPADIVASKPLGDVAKYLGEHPEDGPAILEAENERTNNTPRPGLIKLVESAAAHAE